MKSKFLITAIFIFTSLLVFSQNKRNVFYFSGSGSVSTGFVTNLLIGGVGKPVQTSISEGTALSARSIQYNAQLNFGYTFLASKRFGIGTRLFYKRIHIGRRPSVSFRFDEDIFGYQNSSSELRAESPEFNTFGALFVLKFTSKKSILPFGIEYTLGVGPRFYRMVNKPYYGKYRDTSGSNVTGQIPQINNLDLENQRYSGVEVLFGTELNYAVGTNKFILVGFDVNGSFVRPGTYNRIAEPNYDRSVQEETVEDIYYNRSYADELRDRELFSIWSLHIGYKIVI